MIARDLGYYSSPGQMIAKDLGYQLTRSDDSDVFGLLWATGETRQADQEDPKH